MKNDHNYGYFADVSHSNWTGKTPRHSIGGEYYKEYTASKRIPLVAYAVALIAFITLLTANFI